MIPGSSKSRFVLFCIILFFLSSTKTLFYSHENQMKVFLFKHQHSLMRCLVPDLTCVLLWYVLIFIKKLFFFFCLLNWTCICGSPDQITVFDHWPFFEKKKNFYPVVYIKTAVSPCLVQSDAYLHEMPIKDPFLSIL